MESNAATPDPSISGGSEMSEGRLYVDCDETIFMSFSYLTFGSTLRWEAGWTSEKHEEESADSCE